MSISPGEVIAAVAISVVTFLLVVAIVCSLCQEHRTSRESAATHAAATAAALAALHPPGPPAAGNGDNDDHQEARGRTDAREEENSRPPRASPTAGLPSFTYNVTGGGGEEMCSVCLAAFQAGETVRLLQVCLHLYHVKCIDPWLDVHSTCPICRTGIDSPVNSGGLLPPV